MSRQSDASDLRGVIDHDDPFTSGHQIVKIRQHNRVDPEWTKSDKEIRKVLLRAFPKLATNPKQRDRAGRWMRIIQLYFRKHHTEGRIAEEMLLKVSNVRNLVRAIKEVAAGRRADGSGALGVKARGRPRVKHD